MYAETCPQYLYLSMENFDVPGFEGAKYVFTPPLREKWHQEKLWQGLNADHLQVVSTDHCPFCYKEQKEMGIGDFTKIPNGGPGIEHRMSLVYSGGVAQGRFSVNRFVELVATTPAKLFGLYPAQGDDCRRQRRRPRDLRSQAPAHHQRQDSPHARGLLDVRGNQSHGNAGRGALPRSGVWWKATNSWAVRARASSSRGALALLPKEGGRTPWVFTSDFVNRYTRPGPFSRSDRIAPCP